MARHRREERLLLGQPAERLDVLAWISAQPRPAGRRRCSTDDARAPSLANVAPARSSRSPPSARPRRRRRGSSVTWLIRSSVRLWAGSGGWRSRNGLATIVAASVRGRGGAVVPGGDQRRRGLVACAPAPSRGCRRTAASCRRGPSCRRSTAAAARPRHRRRRRAPPGTRARSRGARRAGRGRRASGRRARRRRARRTCRSSCSSAGARAVTSIMGAPRAGRCGTNARSSAATTAAVGGSRGPRGGRRPAGGPPSGSRYSYIAESGLSTSLRT